MEPLEEYHLDEIKKAGLVDLFFKFERGYRNHLVKKVGGWPSLAERIAPIITPAVLPVLSEKLVPEIRDAPNYNRYKGYLERACCAAKRLRQNYDLGIGIAKKGLWMSYIFGKYGLTIRDILTVREGRNRFTVPLDEIYRRDITNKRIIIFENDVVTGGTLRDVSDHLRKAEPKSIDLLVVFGITRLKKEFYEQVKPEFKHDPHVCEKKDTEIAIDCSSEVLPYVRRIIALDKDFKPNRNYLLPLAKMLNAQLEI